MNDQSEREPVHRTLETERNNPSVQIAEIVADLEDTDTKSLSPTYYCIDEIVDDVFSKPPSAESQLQVTFTYENYRITVEQDGSGRFVKTE